MSKAYDFLKECGSFFVLTINNGCPCGRPFGAVMEIGDDLYISTNDFNQAHKQLRENSNVQIVAKKDNSRNWIRITGNAFECNDEILKNRMYNECEILHKLYPNGLNSHFLMFKINVTNVEIK